MFIGNLLLFSHIKRHPNDYMEAYPFTVAALSRGVLGPKGQKKNKKQKLIETLTWISRLVIETLTWISRLLIETLTWISRFAFTSLCRTQRAKWTLAHRGGLWHFGQ